MIFVKLVLAPTAEKLWGLIEVGIFSRASN